jgi:S-adenosylmethionine hydrolase
VVDPGVGTERRPVGIRTGRGDILVGPDNGLLLLAAEALDGVAACHRISDDRYRLSPVSLTFHGRDIFAPAAGHLASGVDLAALGPPIEPTSLVRLDLPATRRVEGALEATVVSIDSFGSAQLLADQIELEEVVGILAPGAFIDVVAAGAAAGASDAEPRRFSATWRRTYGEADDGETILLVDSYGRLAIAVNRGSAAQRHGLMGGIRVRLSRA